MTFEGEPSEMSEAGELPIPEPDVDELFEDEEGEGGGDRDSETPASSELADADEGRDQAEG
jgi:hypothetical protein